MNSKAREAIIFGFILMLVGTTVHAAGDSDFIRAERYLGQIESGLTDLKPGDFNTYNELAAKATEARTLLEQTTSKDDPGYKGLTDRWNGVAQQLTDIQALWKNSSVMQPDHPILQLNNEVAAFLNNPASIDTSTVAKVAEFEERLEQYRTDPNYPVVAQNISILRNQLPVSGPRVATDKYNPRNWPMLKPDAGPADKKLWIDSMVDLFGRQLAEDDRMMAEDVAAGKAQHNDQVRFNGWAKDTWKKQADERIRSLVTSTDADLRNALGIAARIIGIAEDDGNALMNFASEQNAARNTELLQFGLQSVEVARLLDTTFGRRDQSRDQQEAQLNAALGKLESLKPLAVAEASRRAAQPKTKKKVSGQKLWLNGRVAAEITRAGAVWINSKRVGDIEDNGKIWVGGSVRGEIEDDGDVWHNGNKVGSLGDDRRVWVSGSPVGMIEEDGKVWIGGSAKGTVEGDGDWRKAAVIYYFSFF